MVNAPDSLPALRAHLGRALALMDKKAPTYKRAKEYADGTRAEIAGSSVARSIVEQSEAAPVSFAHIPVEVIADKIELASITSPDTAAAAALQKWMDENDIIDEADDWIYKACTFGDYYVLIDPQEEDDEGRAMVETADTVGSSPLSTIVMYDRKSQRIAEYGVKTWDAGTKDAPVVKASMFYDDATVRLVSSLGTKGTSADDFVLDAEDGAPEEAWVFHNGERMLISHLAIGGKPYGVPVHRKAWGPQDAITKISANNLVNVDAQGLPSRWALMDPSAEVDDDISDDFGTDGPSTPAGSGDGMTGATRATRVRAIPGAIAMLRGVKQVGTFDAGTADPFLKNLDWYVRAMAVGTGIPLFEFDLNGEQPSGEARRRAEGRANRRAAKIKSGPASAFFRNLAETFLAVTGISGSVVVTFNPSETSTDKDGLELVASKVKTGVPLRQALLEAGYTDDLVSEWYPEGAPAVSPEMLGVLAEALSKLGQARTLEVITDEEIRAMLPEILTGARGEGTLIPEAEGVDLGGVQAVTDPETRLKAAAEAAGILIRAGADPEEAAARVGLDGLTFPNVPVTVRLPETAAAGLEGDAPTPAAP